MLHITMVSICSALVGCGGGGAPGDEADPPLDIFSFGGALASAQALSPTTDMQTFGSAQYDGAVRLTLADSASAPLGAVTGQLSFTVNFDQSLDLGQPASINNAPVTGTISDIEGQSSQGEDLSVSGTLSTDRASAPSYAAIASTSFADPPNDDITIVTGGLSAQFAGDVTITEGQDTTSGTAFVTLGGSFVGEGGSDVWGTATAVLVDQGQGPEAPASITGAGEFVASR